MLKGKYIIKKEPKRCPVCNGSGKYMGEKCHGCDGKGWIIVDESYFESPEEKEIPSPPWRAGPPIYCSPPLTPAIPQI